jgi:hypothetical protein
LRDKPNAARRVRFADKEKIEKNKAKIKKKPRAMKLAASASFFTKRELFYLQIG